jgi:hypothetical protein
MAFNDIFEEIINKEVYKGVKVEAKLPYARGGLPVDDIAKRKTDKDFGKVYKEELSKELQKEGYEDLEVLEVDPPSNTITVRYTAYHTGRKQFPEVHLKTLLTIHDERGVDIRAPDVFDEIVELARRDLGGRNKKEKEKRLYHFAALFKEAIC